MGKRIVLAGLYSLPNMGDSLLCEITEYLLKQEIPDAEIIKLDVCPYKEKGQKGLDYIRFRISRRMQTSAKKFAYEDGSKKRYLFEKTMWQIRLRSRFKKCIKGADAIVFAGGGFVKFRTQGLNYYVELIVDIAKKLNIPVMLNAVGVEGYDENDIRCQSLKKALNEDVIKVITTRDDIKTLREKYIYNKNTIIDQVGDPALWTPECYDIKKNSEAKCIGINIIRPNVFRDYGNKLQSQGLENFYVDLLTELERRNIPWKMFSNGMKSDAVMGNRVLERMEISEERKIILEPKTSRELLNIERDFSCVFGARLHACITSYALDIPVLGFIWNEKTRMFAEIIGKKNNFYEEDKLDVIKIVDNIEQSCNSSYDNTVRDKLKEKTKCYIKQFIDKYLR